MVILCCVAQKAASAAHSPRCTALRIFFCVWKKARQRATQATPLRTAPESSGFYTWRKRKLRTAPESSGFYTWRKRQIESRSAESTRRIEQGEKGRGEKYGFSLIT
jgi:hypothetical protein